MPTTYKVLAIHMGNINCAAFILSTILNSGGTFESATKLQKIAFLSIYENNLETFTEFKWHHYGPFSKEIENTVNSLTQENMIVEETINRTSYSGNKYTIKRLSLTPKGHALAKISIAKINTHNKTALLDTINKYGNKPLNKILEYVYNAYTPDDLSK